MNILVCGASIEGWVLGASCAESGNDVFMLDAFDESPLQIPAQLDELDEPGLARLIRAGIQHQRLHCEGSSWPTIDVLLLTTRVADTAACLSKLRSLLPALAHGALIVVAAPLPMGAVKRLQEELAAITPSEHRAPEVVALPLFLRESSALQDWRFPGLLVLGAHSEAAQSRMRFLLSANLRDARHVMFVAPATAEFLRFAFSAMLATRLSLINELAGLAEVRGVDIDVVRRALATDPRIGAEYLFPGCGFGGASLSRDVLSLSESLHAQPDSSGLLDAVLAINESQKELLFRRVWRYFKTDLNGRCLAIWGAAFKPGAVSVDNSPALAVIDNLIAQGAQVCVYDPKAGNAIAQRYHQQAAVTVVDDAYEVLHQADALLLITAWNEFHSPDFARMKTLMKQALIFDGRNVYEPDYVEAMGFEYYAIGRGRHI